MGCAAVTSYARARETIIRICGSNADARALRLEVLAVIGRVVGFDAYAWLITDPETLVGSSPLADIPCLPVLPQLIRLKYLTALNRWTGLPCGAAALSAVAGGDLSQSLMWRNLLQRYQVSDIASSAYRDRFVWLLGIPGPVAHPGTAVRWRRHRLPYWHRRARHSGAAPQSGGNLRPVHRGG
jgi:hypothetical protein